MVTTQIEMLRAEARRAQDFIQMAICDIALGRDAKGAAPHADADARGWIDRTGAGFAHWELELIEAIRSEPDPAAAAIAECLAVITGAAAEA